MEELGQHGLTPKEQRVRRHHRPLQLSSYVLMSEPPDVRFSRPSFQVVILSMDSFYRPLTDKERKDVAEFNFDHPCATLLYRDCLAAAVFHLVMCSQRDCGLVCLQSCSSNKCRHSHNPSCATSASLALHAHPCSDKPRIHPIVVCTPQYHNLTPPTAAFDHALMLETIAKLRNGEIADVPVYDFATHSRYTSDCHCRPLWTNTQCARAHRPAGRECPVLVWQGLSLLMVMVICCENVLLAMPPWCHTTAGRHPVRPSGFQSSPRRCTPLR
jgi:hypothetical protein